jgi:hypothetical protein
MLNDSLFVSDKVVKKEVELPDGSKHELYFKELSHVDFRKYLMAEQSEDDNTKAESTARLIALSLCDEAGKPALDFKQALKLNIAATTAITNAIMQVNGFGAEAKNA